MQRRYRQVRGEVSSGESDHPVIPTSAAKRAKWRTCSPACLGTRGSAVAQRRNFTGHRWPDLCPDDNFVSALLPCLSQNMGEARTEHPTSTCPHISRISNGIAVDLRALVRHTNENRERHSGGSHGKTAQNVGELEINRGRGAGGARSSYLVWQPAGSRESVDAPSRHFLRRNAGVGILGHRGGRASGPGLRLRSLGVFSGGPPDVGIILAAASHHRRGRIPEGCFHG